MIIKNGKEGVDACSIVVFAHAHTHKQTLVILQGAVLISSVCYWPLFTLTMLLVVPL